MTKTCCLCMLFMSQNYTTSLPIYRATREARETTILTSHPPCKGPPGSIIMKKQINCYVDKLNDWPRSGDSDIPPVTHARDLRSAPVAPLIPYVSIRMLDSL